MKKREKFSYDRILSLCKDRYSAGPPEMDAQVALDELCRWLLGDVESSSKLTTEQRNARIVWEIESFYKSVNEV